MIPRMPSSHLSTALHPDFFLTKNDWYNQELSVKRSVSLQEGRKGCLGVNKVQKKEKVMWHLEA